VSKDECIAKCMADGMSRVEAEAAYSKCQQTKASQANVTETSASSTGGTR
jgi:hypothetical protein